MNLVDEYLLKTRQMVASRPHSEEIEDKFLDELDPLWHSLTAEQQQEVESRLGDDRDILAMSETRLQDEIRKLRAGIRIHRDSTGHQLCWYHPELWGLLPDKIEPKPDVPATEEFLSKCSIYRASLDQNTQNTP